MTTEIKETILLDEEEMSQHIKITRDGKRIFSVHDGEPEDNNTGRNFNDCVSVASLMQEAYDAGVAGEEWKFEYEDGVWE